MNTHRNAGKHAGAWLSHVQLAAALGLLSIIWGTQYLVIRAATATIPELWALALRFGVVAVMAQTWLWWKRTPTPHGLAAGRAVYGLAHLASMALLYWGQARVAVALTGLLLALGPFLVALLAHALVPGEQLRRHDLGPLGLATLGAWGMVAGAPAAATGAAGPVMSGFWGPLAVLGAAASGALLRVTAKKLVEEFPVFVLLRDMGVVVGAGALVLAWMQSPVVPSLAPTPLLACLYLGAVGSVLASGIYLRILRDVAVGTLAYQQFLTALVSLVAGAWLGNDPAAPLALAGGVLVLAALVWRVRSA